ncbi:MAG: response regulator [Anaerolineales bacterium]|uniref:HD-GYP domain-containing protein n=1 Tax=Candidatus Villigracilis proximus TaxID=3140683 RepID=UPI00313764C9|nr:response regulator [Anaerolineales bacterium]
MTSTILIVDDDPAGRQTLESILDEQGYQLEFAENGAQALQMIRKILPDVILLDVMMPGMDGFEVCRQVRSDPAIAEIPIIMLTALDDRRSFLNGLESGADDYLTKPYDRHELRARLLGITRLNRYRKLQDDRTNIEQAHSQLLSAYDATIEGWSRAMDLRDKETEGHTQRVTQLSEKLAKIAGIRQDELIQIRRGSLLHDIGKLGVPDSILLTPNKLTDGEWEVMRKHPQYAYEMIQPIEYLRPALDIPYCHHEKWDGTGYPRGLKGEEIPLSARIFAIVDVWDALTSDRPYRAAWDKQKTLQYINEQSGKHFDPHIVELFNIMMA